MKNSPHRDPARQQTCPSRYHPPTTRYCSSFGTTTWIIKHAWPKVATPTGLYLKIRRCNNFYYHHKFLKLFNLNSFPWSEEIHFLKRNLCATNFLKFGLKNLKNEVGLGLMDDFRTFRIETPGPGFFKILATYWSSDRRERQ